MSKKRLVIVGCAVLAWSVGTAFAGPCDTTGRAANDRDAGSGPTVGSSHQTVGAATTNSSEQHPPTSTMNRASGDVATSSQDAQKQMQGEPTAAQQGEGAKSNEKLADKDC